MAEPKTETQAERPVLLILYADGEIYISGAPQTYGDLLAPMDIITREAERIRAKLLGTPLRPAAKDTA